MSSKNIKRFDKSKKAQIGSTLSWIAGVIIIIFMIILFLAGVAFMASLKSANVKKTDLDDMFNQGLSKNEVRGLLNYEINGQTVKELVDKSLTADLPGDREDSKIALNLAMSDFREEYDRCSIIKVFREDVYEFTSPNLGPDSGGVDFKSVDQEYWFIAGDGTLLKIRVETAPCS